MHIVQINALLTNRRILAFFLYFLVLKDLSQNLSYFDHHQLFNMLRYLIIHANLIYDIVIKTNFCILKLEFKITFII